MIILPSSRRRVWQTLAGDKPPSPQFQPVDYRNPIMLRLLVCLLAMLIFLCCHHRFAAARADFRRRRLFGLPHKQIYIRLYIRRAIFRLLGSQPPRAPPLIQSICFHTPSLVRSPPIRPPHPSHIFLHLCFDGWVRVRLEFQPFREFLINL